MAERKKISKEKYEAYYKNLFLNDNTKLSNIGEDDKTQLNVPNYKSNSKGVNMLRKQSTFKTIIEDVKEDDKSSVVHSTHIQNRNNEVGKLKIIGKSLLDKLMA